MVPELFVKIVEEYKDFFTIKEILELFDVPKATYYRWRKKTEWIHEVSSIEKRIISLCDETDYAYGYRNITGILRKENIFLNKNTVQRIMQKHGLQCQVRPKRAKMYSGRESYVASNILNRTFNASRPLEKLVTDITYLPYGSKVLYLSSIKDLYNGEIIAYTISDTQDIDFVLDTLNQLPPLTKPCILHSDQGTVYTSHAYTTALKRKSITASMSRKGTPADNAPIESFHSCLKSETFYRYPELKSSNKIVTQTVIEYIKHYNNNRIQKKLNFMSPIEYRRTQCSA